MGSIYPLVRSSKVPWGGILRSKEETRKIEVQHQVFTRPYPLTLGFLFSHGVLVSKVHAKALYIAVLPHLSLWIFWGLLRMP